MYFRDKYAFLSNMYPCIIKANGMVYRSSEHYYQAHKAINELDHHHIRAAAHGVAAKRRARKLEKRGTVRKDWKRVRVDIMRDALNHKFRQNNTLRTLLIGTADIPIVEHNKHRDMFWGVCDGRGENHLGKLLMELRETLQREESGNEFF